MTLLADDLEKLRQLKEKAEEIGRDKSAADGDFKQWQAACIRRMQAEKSASFRHPDVGYLFTCIPDRVKGQVDDKRLFVRWALEQDESIQEFLDDIEASAGLVERFYEAITSTSLVSYAPNQTACNSMAKRHVDDEQPLPPGLNFRPDPYIQQLKS